MGVGPAGQHPDYPGLASERDISENNQRLFYRRWEEAHDRAWHQRPARQEPQHLPVRLKTGSGTTWN
jgi:hypothetical protein